MIDIKGIGSEGVIIIGLFLFFKDVFIPLWKRVIIPRWAKLVKKPPNNPNSTQRLNPNAVTAKEVLVALEAHEKADDDRTKLIQENIGKIRDKQSGHGERLASLESRQ